MELVSANTEHLSRGVSKCVEVGDDEQPTSSAVMNLATQGGARTTTGLCLIRFPKSEPDQIFLSPAEIENIFNSQSA